MSTFLNNGDNRTVSQGGYEYLTKYIEGTQIGHIENAQNVRICPL